LKYFQRAVFAPESKNCHFLTISLPKSAHHCTNSNPFLLADFPTFATVAKGYPTSCHRGKNVVCLNMETLTHEEWLLIAKEVAAAKTEIARIKREIAKLRKQVK
jgi:hypothetical protein